MRGYTGYVKRQKELILKKKKGFQNVCKCNLLRFGFCFSLKAAKKKLTDLGFYFCLKNRKECRGARLVSEFNVSSRPGVFFGAVFLFPIASGKAYDFCHVK